MKYFLDTEFLEGPQKERFPISLFRKETLPTIDLISIGIVAEDGRELYLISKDFNLKEAWNRFQFNENWLDGKYYWIRENVLKPIYYELRKKLENKTQILISSKFCYKDLKILISKYGKTNKEIAEEIVSFTTFVVTEINKNGTLIVGATEDFKPIKSNFVWDKPEFYAYYADYDWVVFCWLFGKMMDLPTGYPKYCHDLKQILYEKEKIQLDNYKHLGNNAPNLKQHIDYPKQENEHNALADARWNKKLYEFLNNL